MWWSASSSLPSARFPHTNMFFFFTPLSLSAFPISTPLRESTHLSVSPWGQQHLGSNEILERSCLCMCLQACNEYMQLPQEYHLAALLGSRVTLNDLSEMWTVLLRIIFCEMKTSIKAVNCPQAKTQAAECISVVHRI